MKLLEKIKQNIKDYNLFSPDEKIILAVSGGVDSIVLLDILAKLHKNLLIAHLNHGLRKESFEEEKFIKELAKKYNKKAILGKASLGKSKSNLEERARDARYDFLKEVAQRNKCSKIVTAHHGDDQLETVMLNYLRGTDIFGLSGMDFISRSNGFLIVRPTLNILKEEIFDYQRKNKLAFMEDKSNYDLRFKRNHLRHTVFKNISTNERRILLDVISQIRERNSIYKDELKKLYKKSIFKKGQSFVALSKEVEKFSSDIIFRLLTLAVADIKGESKNIYSYTLNNLINNIKASKSGLEFHLSQDLTVLVERDCILVMDKSLRIEKVRKRKLYFGVNKIKECGLNIALSKNKSIINLDKDSISLPLYVRSYKRGDKFLPLGMKGTKKIKDFFIDEKIPRRLRPCLPLIVDSKNVILGVLGIRFSDSGKITKNTKNVVGLDYKKE
jgi:tRNA(Ile)-lysidine synthase